MCGCLDKNLSEAELTVDDPKGMVHFGAEVGLCRLNQIQKSALWRLWTYSALAGLHGNSELSLAVLDIATFLVAMGFRVAVADGATHPIGEAFCAAVELLLALGD